jgi:mRNA interferase RelE/StbE
MSEQPYHVQFTARARKEFKALDNTIAERVLEKIEQLAQRIDNTKHEAMKGQFSGYYKLRVGNYRVLYTLDREARILLVEVIGHRRDVYDE